MHRNCCSGNLIVVFFILLCSLQVFSLSCGEASTDGENAGTNKEQTKDVGSVSSIILPIIEIISGEAPTVEAIEKHLGTKAVKEKKYKAMKYFRLKVPEYKILSQTYKNILDVVEIVPQNNRYLKFKEVSAVLGKFVPGIDKDGNEDRAFFLHKNPQTKEMVGISVHLSTPPSDPEARVLSIAIWRGVTKFDIDFFEGRRDKQPEKPFPISSILIPIAEIVSGETPTLEAIEKHFGIKATEETNAKNNFRLIRLNIPGYEIRISNDKTRQVIDSVTCPPSFRVTVHPNNDYNSQYLQFKEVEAVLGKWVLLGESKTSYVYFLYKNARTGKLIEISVHLLHSPEYREGMVLCILMRSDKASDFILEKFR